MPDLATIQSFLEKFGLTRGLFALFFIGAHWAHYKTTKARLKDKNSEIDRLAKDNHEYRERFMRLLDDKYKVQQYTSLGSREEKK